MCSHFSYHSAVTEIYGDVLQDERTPQFLAAINPNQNTAVNERHWLIAYKTDVFLSWLAAPGKGEKLTIILEKTFINIGFSLFQSHFTEPYQQGTAYRKGASRELHLSVKQHISGAAAMNNTYSVCE